MSGWIKKSMQRTGLARLPYADNDEKDFCQAWLNHQEASTAKFTCLISIPFHFAVAAVFAPATAPDLLVRKFQVLHYTIAAILVVGYLLSRRGVKLQPFVGVAWHVLTIGLAYLLFFTVNNLNDPDTTLVIASTLTAISMMQGILLPFHNWVPYGSLLLTSLVGVVAMWNHPVVEMWSILFSSSCLYSLAYHNLFVTRSHSDAVREFRARSNILPAHVVRRSINFFNNFEKVFEPKHRYCVCISSDWRNYQKLAAEMDSAALASILNKYYQHSVKILNQLMPEKNFFIDWIADELFIVLFGIKEMEERELVNQALSFGIQLIKTKQAFAKKYGLPQAIDVGISQGKAHIGLMGPRGNMKATALGEVPGKARRFQTTGKLLRSELGDDDRIIFGADSLMMISAPFAVKPFKLASKTKLRNLEDREIFYMAPLSEKSEAS